MRFVFWRRVRFFSSACERAARRGAEGELARARKTRVCTHISVATRGGSDSFLTGDPRPCVNEQYASG